MNTIELLPDLAAAARDAVSAIRNAIQSGDWLPDPDTDPLDLALLLTARLDDGLQLSDLPLIEDLAAEALAAIDFGAWRAAGEDDLSALQGMAFLAGFLGGDSTTSISVSAA